MPLTKGAEFLCMLKVHKREIFITELFTLRDPIWVGDLAITEYEVKIIPRLLSMR
jgi:hypothetical protein